MVVAAREGVVNVLLLTRRAVPLVATSYQSITALAGGVACNTSVPLPQRESPVTEGAAVTAPTVTVRVAVALEQPPVPVTVYVIVAVPEETPVTTPDELFTVATAMLLDVQEPPLSPSDEKVVFPEGQIFCEPESEPALGAVVTVTVRVADEAEQPFPLAKEYEIVEVPAPTPVTTPVEFTVATEVLLDDHVPFKLPFVVIVVLPFEHRDCVPLSEPATEHGLRTRNMAAVYVLLDMVANPAPVAPGVGFNAQAAPMDPSSAAFVL